MKQFNVTVFCEFEVEVQVTAASEEAAESLAHEQVSQTYSVYQNDIEETMPFDGIFAYVEGKKPE